MTKKQKKGLFKIVLLIGTIISLYFVPWILVRAWITPLPETVQEQVNKTTDYGFDGIIVYVDEKGKPPVFLCCWFTRPKKQNPCRP